MQNERRDVNATNVFSLSEARAKKEKREETERFRDFLNVLSQEELEVEVKSFFTSLESKPFSTEKALMGKMLLEELASRISNSPMKANSINGMKNAINKKIEGFEVVLN